jgi:hypothetical protein
MEEESYIPSTPIYFRGRFLYLLILILGMLIMVPLVEKFVRLRMITDVFMTAIFIAAAYAISRKAHHVLIAIALLVPMLVSLWFEYFVNVPPLQIAGWLCGVIYFAYAVIVILIFIFEQREVTRDLIAGAAVVYLMMALMWSFLYKILEMLQPGSFTIAETAFKSDKLIFVYYSFVTITTLGFGDITPTTGLASSLSILEAVIGQLFLVVAVAWLVGVHVSQSLERNHSGKEQ